ncbi:NAD(P)-dependent glycerol-3-phosphate dehydrogenase [Reichenbachiella carrageenanivorans]|uniref:Glycerol-3-phosphate dehydrogenase [NAD(P)+] n=1 Tax=Reichenbachiella carrageenanivorans TaxID=2979869 RepID=A0ABY6CVH1_9BACT|nr:NAD(P)H-dependent glycerol-3-phosphate dehydrogenase [Reichenbachiella carrageenanivorans]UXX77905.1 NAD(P)-dependent glycerol-3-phosphate dehydrogenase [Reichenbachiella carrageenanivorans]
MSSKNTSDKVVGVIGAGSFGTAIANMLAEKTDVLLYVRDKTKAEEFEKNRAVGTHRLSDRIRITNQLSDIGVQCEIIFPIVPSANFREMIRNLAPHLKPYHILIHGTKGLDMTVPEGEHLSKKNPLSRKHVKTMSEVILEETTVLRVGCLAGPNLAKEIEEKQPAAAVVASHFEEVIDQGQKLLKNDRFLVYGSNDLIGIELCGVLKNIIAIGTGMVSGMGLGENSRAMLISRGMVEMVYIGNALGGNTKAFLGLAGVGDLVATCSSKLSRNFTVGFRMAKGESLDDIIQSMEEVAEGVNTIKIIDQLAESYNIRVPITETLHNIIKGEMSVKEAYAYFMKFPFRSEIDFI